MSRYAQSLLIASSVLAIAAVGCVSATASSTERNPSMQNDSAIPSPATFTTAPLRNRIRVELDAPVADVWTLVGDIARLPEYSAGLERIDVTKSSAGEPQEYVCHFKPAEPGVPGAVSRDFIRWYVPNRGWASLAEEPNEFGLRNSLHLVTLASSAGRTQLKWDAHYDVDDLDASRSELDKALGDIADRLIQRFGGRILERHVQQAR